ncbi:hypothetical protein INT46_003345 [Mucor plumbeus]|uniref:Uncharacterized protein n=1 Tax=Mucor plumbeus TaxID=97098 RepID=A0A8H7R3J0_9FUNG|nr:hypothetical protein INT46_003345 [Mucor plumbeus]
MKEFYNRIWTTMDVPKLLVVLESIEQKLFWTPLQEDIYWNHYISRNQINVNGTSINDQRLFNNNSTDVTPLQNDFAACILNNDFSTATVSVIEPIDPTATLIVKVVAVLNADDENFTGQSSLASLSNDTDLSDSLQGKYLLFDLRMMNQQGNKLIFLKYCIQQ